MGVRFKTDPSLSECFRKARGQSTEDSSNTSLKGVPNRKKSNSSSNPSGYSQFLEKYRNLESSFVRFTTQDLVYFFREKSREAGARYVIANMKRDMGIFKKLQDNFDIPEILLMIEFIFSGDQTYLDIHRTQPTVLASSWVNTIYRDSIDWANGDYVPQELKSSTKTLSKREWKKTDSYDKTVIGEWE